MTQVSTYLARLPKPGGYARAWSLAKSMPDQWFRDVQDYGRSQLRIFMRALQARINTRGGVVLLDCDASKVRRKVVRAFKRGRVRCECRWCGTPLQTYQDPCRRFCDAGCMQAHRGF